MSSPSTSTVPSVGRSSAPITDSSEVLPDPEGPVSAVKSPGSSASEIPSRATIEPGCPLRTPLTTTRAPRPSLPDTHPVVEVPGAAALRLHHDAERQPVADRPRRPGHRPVAVGALERIRRAALERVPGRDHLAAVEELVVGGGVHGLAGLRPGGHPDRPPLAGGGVVAGRLQAGDERGGLGGRGPRAGPGPAGGGGE